MTFAQKLARLSAYRDLPKSTASKRAGLPQNAVSDYISRGYLPRADTALRLARVFEVPLDWLMSEDFDWPPPSGTAVTTIATDVLVAELGRRMHHDLGPALKMLAAAEREDWIAVGRELVQLNPDKPPSPAVLRKLRAFTEVRGVTHRLHAFAPQAVMTDDEATEMGIASASHDGRSYTMLDVERRAADVEHRIGFREVFQLAFDVWPAELFGAEKRWLPAAEVRAKLAEAAATFDRLAKQEAGHEAAMKQVYAELSDVERVAIGAAVAADEALDRAAAAAAPKPTATANASDESAFKSTSVGAKPTRSKRRRKGT